ncbi:unnamed protein product [Macrosiphum euphorbiae]|uniref:Uncharacterized protein n=1 Tax=Macrosiphum euphorbiae TaxID=13131 RepID=A0AAV0XDH5_9HEMI|nr:unnamed protein product [Macrosiphum euphorbiae]
MTMSTDWVTNQIPNASVRVASLAQSDAVSPAAPGKRFLSACCTAGLLTVSAINAVITSPAHNRQSSSAKHAMAKVKMTVTISIKEKPTAAVRLSSYN